MQGTNFPVDSVGFSVGNSEYWKFPARGYTSGDVTLKIYWYAAATTGNVQWEAALAAINIGTDTGSIEAKAFGTATDVQTATNANAKAGSLTTITITGAALNSLAADDLTVISINRIAASSGEMTGQALLLYAVVSWP